ncbi:MAG TPA: hypothetical protein VFX70_20085 [Mycobacteriales bacterium]|nr:hypothetical protein [Mycobacteriales bacterium]
MTAAPRPYPVPDLPGPTVERLAAFARHILTWHRPAATGDGHAPHYCTCGSPLVLCPYRSAATHHLDPTNDSVPGVPEVGAAYP